MWVTYTLALFFSYSSSISSPVILIIFIINVKPLHHYHHDHHHCHHYFVWLLCFLSAKRWHVFAGSTAWSHLRPFHNVHNVNVHVCIFAKLDKLSSQLPVLLHCHIYALFTTIRQHTRVSKCKILYFFNCIFFHCPMSFFGYTCIFIYISLNYSPLG